jgi:hypothetical protein
VAGFVKEYVKKKIASIFFNKPGKSPKLFYFLYHICKVFIRLIFFWSWSTPYNKASAVGGQPGT